jgi:hypothetical protein
MTNVHTHAATTPVMIIARNHDCGVGNGSTAAWYRSSANAATTDTTSCDTSIQPIRMAGA